MRAPLRALSLLAVVAAAACDADTIAGDPDAGGACNVLFGRPNEHTGLDATQCQPACTCGATPFAPPDYDEAFVASLVTDWKLADPFGAITADPYAAPPPAPDAAGTVCAVLPTPDATAHPRPYTLVTYATEADARAAGANPTHFGACGVCSTLENLAAYMRQNDLTAPVRACGLQSSDEASNVACLQKLGFDLPCAQIWYWNTVHTRSTCLSVCLAALNQPYQLPDGSLNPCIQCDEVQSGPVFKAVAGRTRRNSGLPNALCRPCSEVRPLVHRYGG